MTRRGCTGRARCSAGFSACRGEYRERNRPGSGELDAPPCPAPCCPPRKVPRPSDCDGDCVRWSAGWPGRPPAGALETATSFWHHGPMTPVAPGDVLAGKYRVTRVLGIGGMGVVVAATHIQLDEPVALKFMLPEALGSADAVARFLREARAAVQLHSEHVARVSDVGTLDTGAPYIVMEYLDGTDLVRRAQVAAGRCAPDEAVEHVLQACDALAEAHSLGIIHRDLEAREPVSHAATRRHAARQGARLRDLEGAQRARVRARSRGRARSWARRSTCRPSR